jgi:HEAT repeat protein
MTSPHIVLALALLTAASAPAQDTLAPAVPAVATPAENTHRAWDLLDATVKDTKHVDAAIQGLAALGTMGTDAHAAELITAAMKDPERDIRIAAILAAGQTKNPRLIQHIRVALDDAEPEVGFVAATTLWKLHDHAGEDFLRDVADGDRKANGTLAHTAGHSAHRTLHSPAALAKIGATEGATLLLGPFGIGVAAADYARKNGGDSARAASIDLLAEQHTPDIHQELIDALGDKDAAVRASAAKALGQWNDPATATALAPLIDDTKLPVRLTAAAAYLRTSTGHRTTAKSKTP